MRTGRAFVGALCLAGLAACSQLESWSDDALRTAFGVTLTAPAPTPGLRGPAAPAPKTRRGALGPLEEPVVSLGDETPGAWPEPSAEEIAHLEGEADRIDPDRSLVAIASETKVYSEPRFRSRKLGYLRAGAVVARADSPSGHDQCSEGWYRIEPEGFVCVGKTASLDPDHPLAQATRVRPNRRSPLPYRYGKSKFPTSPFYTRVPTQLEQQRTEQDYRGQMRRLKWKDLWKDEPVGDVPEFLRDGRPAPSLHGYVHSRKTVYTGRALTDSGFAFSHLFEHEGRKYGLSLDLAVMPLDRLKPVSISDFRGVALGGDMTLPLVFVHTRAGVLFEGSPTTGLKMKRRLKFREAVPITGKRVRIGDVRYLETRDGGWLRDLHMVHVKPMKRRPKWAKPGRTWIDVSILRQVLVAYEGTEPVFATLVSTGAAGLGDPEKTHATVRGRFLIHTKHVTATMSGDEKGDEFDLRDVPYVQYFTEGYALHAAYWHNQFGRPRSHGCINLSPRDAQWLFEWTDPPVPERWHAAMSLREGTLVSVHP